jgi:tRNA A-37 threonylcarbamoyl transferase component Bud32/tetratricopeptide (TPR) repeat protein
MSLPKISQPPDAAVDADLSGRQLGDFALVRRLGRGAMAEVYLAEQASLRRPVAIKVLKSQLAHDESYVRRFHHEAQAAASLVHANIVQIYEVGCKDGIHYIAQEYVQGQNLRELINRRGPLDVPLVVLVMRQVALALQKAAACGLVHRDIKPENIMLTREGEVKVADFGLARLSGATELNLTQVGITMGTPLYMSPEQVEGRAVDPRSDIYSFGVTCFHMLTGAPPFRGDTALSVAVQHLKTQPQRLEQLRPDLEPALCRIVHKLLAKDPAQRYASPRDLLQELRTLEVAGPTDEWWQQVDLSEGLALHDGRAGATQQLAALMKTEALAARRTRRRRLLIGIILLSAFLLGGGVAWLTRPRSLLAGAQPLAISKQSSAQAQFFFAQLQTTDREAWLKSVKQYFPTNEYFVNRAKQELARYYLQHNRLDDAYRLFSELARLDDSQPENRAFGLAGQSIVLAMQGRHEEAVKVLAQLGPLRSKLDPRMASLLVYPLSLVQKAMDKKTADQWQQWTSKLPKEEPAETGAGISP